VVHDSITDLWVVPDTSLTVTWIKHQHISASHQNFKSPSGGTMTTDQYLTHIRDAARSGNIYKLAVGLRLSTRWNRMSQCLTSSLFTRNHVMLMSPSWLLIMWRLPHDSSSDIIWLLVKKCDMTQFRVLTQSHEMSETWLLIERHPISWQGVMSCLMRSCDVSFHWRSFLIFLLVFQ